MAKGHRMFAAVWALQERVEDKTTRALRKEVVGGAAGRVLEVGVGAGANLPFLPKGADYAGVDPDRHMMKRARKRASELGLEADLREVGAEDLPFEDAAFDTVVTTLTFCSVGDASAGLREVYRVLKEGGEFRFAEHVRSDNRTYARVQSLLKVLTRPLTGGCEHDRDFIKTLRAAGFNDVEYRKQRVTGIPFVVGAAKR